MMQLRELNNVSSTNFYLNVLIVNLTIEKNNGNGFISKLAQ